jgi:hypothetical protein
MIARACVFLTLLALSCEVRADGAPTWKAGAARVKITPEKPMWMSGYASRTKPAEGTLIDLWAKALVLEDPRGQRAVLVTMDLVGIDRELSSAVCKEISAKYHLPRSAIALSVSHTHTGPVVNGNLNVMYTVDEQQQQLIVDYARVLQKNLVAVVGEAMEKLAPAQLAWGNGLVTLAVNRRTNKEPDVDRLRQQGQLQGPVDHEVPVLTVRDGEGRVRAVVCGYACHATVLSSYEWSGDWPGFAQLELEKTYPDAIALYWTGCGGDQNPLPRRSVALAQEYGKQFAAGVEAAVRAPMHPITGKLTTSLAEVELPFAELPSRDQLLQDSTVKDRFVATRARLLLKEIERKGDLRGTYPYPVQAWQVGPDLTFVLLGGEAVVDYSLRLKKELGPGRVWVAAYANDVMAYIPSLRVLKEGGYEGATSMIYYGLPTVWSPKIEETIVAAVHDEVNKVRSEAGPEEWKDLRIGKDFDAWKEKPADWALADSVMMDSANPKKLVFEPGSGILVNGAKGGAKDLVTKDSFRDIEMHIEFLIPKGSNSGVKFHAHYEVQIFDSFGVKELTGSDCGGIYPRAELKPNYHHLDKGIAPRVNACKEPGEWQALDVIFLSPRFDKDGKKIANARIVKAELNGKLIHENQEIETPTGHAWHNKEMESGPILLQGDHGPVAFRNFRVRRCVEK